MISKMKASVLVGAMLPLFGVHMSMRLPIQLLGNHTEAHILFYFIFLCVRGNI